ncbi:Protocadherin Fat 3 [Bagarius yarrelli]|uniref:Protocadherin Fat 3 n=1 Tax=Bagarius yarrelli TaxID=175774 RepID=A0A556TTR2_BAGYA|nr:Protocadherin Fat 3 [Bagarius yarrelli]
MYHASVPENSPKDVSIIQIQAQDPDATVTEPRFTFRIASGNPQNFFSINARTEKLYQVRLPERGRRQRGGAIYRIFAYDADYGSNAELTYSIVDGNDDAKFHIDPKSGLVSSPRKQFPAKTYDILTVKAVDNGRPQRWATARLHIEWIRRPTPSSASLAFEEPLYNFTVMESDKVADIVGVVSAQQQDSAPLWFDITAVGTLIIAKPLDAEQRSFYNLTVEPTYEVMVTEDTPPDTEVLQLLASDRDEHHRLTFALLGSVDPASMRLFRVDANTGHMFTTQRLDHETNTQHVLTVMVMLS